MFNYITDIIEWFSPYSIFLNMTKTNTIIFSRPSSPLSITHPFLLYLQTSHRVDYYVIYLLIWCIHSSVFNVVL